VIDHVVRNADGFSHSSRIVHIVDGATTPLHRLRHALVVGQATLVPELHGEPHNLVSLRAQHGRDGR